MDMDNLAGNGSSEVTAHFGSSSSVKRQRRTTRKRKLDPDHDHQMMLEKEIFGADFDVSSGRVVADDHCLLLLLAIRRCQRVVGFLQKSAKIAGVRVTTSLRKNCRLREPRALQMQQRGMVTVLRGSLSGPTKVTVLKKRMGMLAWRRPQTVETRRALLFCESQLTPTMLPLFQLPSIDQGLLHAVHVQCSCQKECSRPKYCLVVASGPWLVRVHTSYTYCW